AVLKRERSIARLETAGLRLARPLTRFRTAALSVENATTRLRHPLRSQGTRRTRFLTRYIVGGTIGGGALSLETHAERSKNRNSSAFCCAESGPLGQPLGMLATVLCTSPAVCRSV